MTREQLLRAVGDIRDDFIREAAPPSAAYRKRLEFPLAGAVAACLALVLVGSTFLLSQMGMGGSDGSTATITLGEEATLTVELSKDALSLSGEAGVAMLRAMVATFTAYQKDVDTLSIRCEGQELTVEGHTAQDFLGQGLNITRTAETDYRE